MEDDANVVKCAYERCSDRTSHRTPACRDLHHRCRICHHRGHTESEDCWTWSARQYNSARDAFEAVADRGVLTCHRRRDERWGFFCHIKGTPFPYCEKYSDLLAQPVRTIDRSLGLYLGDPTPLHLRLPARLPAPPSFHTGAGRSRGLPREGRAARGRRGARGRGRGGRRP